MGGRERGSGWDRELAITFEQHGITVYRHTSRQSLVHPFQFVDGHPPQVMFVAC